TATPAARSPPPTGTRTVPTSGTSARISKPTVPTPAWILGSPIGLMKDSGEERQVSSSRILKISVVDKYSISAPCLRIKSTLHSSAPFGTVTRHRTPRRFAAQARASPAFPRTGDPKSACQLGFVQMGYVVPYSANLEGSQSLKIFHLQVWSIP